MKWKNIFIPVKNMDRDQARKFINDHSVGDYQILDVRQPREYERGHIAGAIWIPIAQLHDRYDELDRNKPVIAYWEPLKIRFFVRGQGARRQKSAAYSLYVSTFCRRATQSSSKRAIFRGYLLCQRRKEQSSSAISVRSRS